MRDPPLHPDGLAPDDQPELAALAGAYRVIADAFVYPEHVDGEAYRQRARETVCPAVERHVDSEAADELANFLDAHETLDVDEYVETLDLDPACPPYLGHHAFEEPETCREVADADRNQYMVELNAIYEHFDVEIGDELPDYLPAMVEFCWLTLPERDDAVRAEFLGGMVSLVPAARSAFEGTPYHALLVALERVLDRDLALTTDVDDVDSAVGRAEDGLTADGVTPTLDSIRERPTGDPATRPGGER